MTFLLPQLSTSQTVPSAAALLKQNQGPEALMTSDAVSSALIKENKLTEEQLKHVHEIMQQKDDNTSKSKDLEKSSLQPISDGPKADSKSITALQKLPDAIIVQSIFPNLKLHEVRDIRRVSKTVKSQAIRSLRFRSRLSWEEIKGFLKAGGDVNSLANVKAIGGEGLHEVTDDDIEQISHLPKLEKIDLGGDCSRLTDRAYIALGTNAHELTHCNLSNAEITNAGVEAIAIGCKKLSEIILSQCRKIDEGALIALGTHAHELTSLHASHTKIVSKKGIEALAIGCKKLSQINFRGCPISDDDLATLGTYARNLTNCNFGGSRMILTNSGIEALAKGCQKLSQINLSCCPNIDDGALIALGTYASELTHCIANNTKVTNVGMIALVKGCKKLSEIDLSSCPINDKVFKDIQDDALALTNCKLSFTEITKEAAERFNANRKEQIKFIISQ